MRGLKPAFGPIGAVFLARLRALIRMDSGPRPRAGSSIAKKDPSEAPCSFCIVVPRREARVLMLKSFLLFWDLRPFVDQFGGVEIILPVDFTCSSKFGEDGEIKEGRNGCCARSEERLRELVFRAN